MTYWIPLKYLSSNSDISSRYLQQMMSQESSSINFPMSPYDYVTSLCPGVSNNIKRKVPSVRSLLLFPLEERLKKLLIEGSPIHRFSVIKHFAPEYSEEELLQFLEQHAILVQGLWTAKTVLLDFPIGEQILSRDYTLLLFSKNLKVDSSQVYFRRDLAPYITEFLNIFGEERSEDWKPNARAEPTVYWKFREHPNVSFIKHYSNIVTKQQEVFECMEPKVLNAVYKGRKVESGKNAPSKHSLNSKPGQSVNSDKCATNVGGVHAGKMTHANDSRKAPPGALKNLLNINKVCSFQMIWQLINLLN